MDSRGEKRTIETEQHDTTQPKKVRQRVKVEMDDIPNQLLLELFQYFDHMEKYYRRGVSKRWRVVLKSRSIMMQTYLAIEVPVNVRPNSRPGEISEEFIWTVGKHIKTIVFYGRSEKFVTASMAYIIGARLKRFTKAQRAMFQDIQSYFAKLSTTS
ncbi:hypothetical protein RvY_19262 [Ramazzottius varieornatus]|uniref:F-box domain-containing protein n=1 Tax=Ramazzottius varieornatus TaxID=947166 RepID=A0A1D1W8V2_RAMVA|nr:hypothetical protein RvY_19262 [Ramazzottius varieornatus]